MDFKKITLNDKETITPFLSSANELTCESSFVNLLVWQPLYDNCYCVEDNILYLRSQIDRSPIYSLPFGDVKTGMQKIIEHSSTPYPDIWAQDGARFRQFKELYGKYYDICENRNEFDYIYNSQDLITLSGKKYHSKRNHISAFSKRVNWHYEDITAANADKVKHCAEIWYTQNVDRIDDGLKTEMSAVSLMLDNMEILNISGGAVLVDGEVVAFTLGSPINDCVYDIHIEKALPKYDIAYTVINREFAARNIQNRKYINRENDLG